VARRQAAHLLALRSAVALGGLRRSEGRIAEARMLLEEAAAAVPDAPLEDRRDVDHGRVTSV
jgi:hypothetical protein